jgi:DNA-binding SARP family transcriptional activator
VLDALPYGVLTVAPDGTVIGANAQAHVLLPGVGTPAMERCDDLFACRAEGGPCEHQCLAVRAGMSTEALPEIRIDTASGISTGALWVTFAPLRHRPEVILHLRPGHAGDRRRRSEPHWLFGPELQIRAFGRTLVEARGDVLNGDWVGQRPGQVLKYLVTVRKRVAMADEIAESIWPGSGQRSLSNTRHVIHRLREKLEPRRAAHARSSFVIAIAGGYALDSHSVWIDVDEFERSVQEGSTAMDRLDHATATRRLEHAIDLYRGDFLADEPYADWAYDERTRLASLATYSLRVLTVLAHERGDALAAIKHLERLSELEPYDAGVCRELITALLYHGHHSEAKRRYTGFARRLRREFGEEPGFDLKSLRVSPKPVDVRGSG